MLCEKDGMGNIPWTIVSTKEYVPSIAVGVIGQEVHGIDNPRKKEEVSERVKEHWTQIFETAEQAWKVVRDLAKSNRYIEIIGGDLGLCVSALAAHAINCGFESVIIPKKFTGWTSKTSFEETLEYGVKRKPYFLAENMSFYVVSPQPIAKIPRAIFH